MRAEDITSIDSEAGIIASLIHSPELAFHSEHLFPNHFSKKDNGYIYTAICSLARRGIRTVDPYNILEALESSEATRGYVSELSVERLNELMDMSDILARRSVEEYKMLVANVMDAAFRRDTFTKLRDCQALCYNRSETGVERKIYDIIDDVMTEYSVVDDIPMFCDVADDLWADIERHQDGNESGIPFKFPTLNEYVRIEPGELVVLGAPAKGAKSMFMLNEAVDILRQGKSVMYIDSELSSRLFLCRLVSHLTGIEFNRVRSGRYDEAEAARIKEQIAWIKQQKLVHMYKALAYVMRYESVYDTKYAPFYACVASWSNQPGMFRHKTFREFAILRGQRKTIDKGACWRAMEAVEEMWPDIAERYFDFTGQPKSTQLKNKT